MQIDGELHGYIESQRPVLSNKRGLQNAELVPKSVGDITHSPTVDTNNKYDIKSAKLNTSPKSVSQVLEKASQIENRDNEQTSIDNFINY